jgi:alkylation response protein AidB-like acyl-CoA dehydrogenase
MDFSYSPEDEAFRREFRNWLEANAPKVQDGGEEWQYRLAWHRKMHAAGWVGICWPKEYGGRGVTITQQLIYNQELAKANSPMLVNGLGIMLVGPTLMHWGTEEQKKRHVPKILSADEIWC